MNGHVYPEVDRAPLDSAYRQRKILYVNRRDGTFGDVSLRAGPGIALEKSSRGAAFGDLFNTGQVNAVVNNMNDAPTLLHNRRPGPNHALLIELEGTRSNRSAIGARVSVQAQGWRMIDEVRSGGSFCSQNDLRLRFGLGPRQEAESVEIAWPSGRTEIFHRVAADQWVRIREGAGIVASRKFLPPPQLPR